jgi:hypothetical protein
VANTVYHISTCVYTLKLIYPTHKNYAPSQHYKESITHCATIDLYVSHGIESYQTSASTINFVSDRDRMFACLLLSSSDVFTPVIVE